VVELELALSVGVVGGAASRLRVYGKAWSGAHAPLSVSLKIARNRPKSTPRSGQGPGIAPAAHELARRRGVAPRGLVMDPSINYMWSQLSC